jgi:hypothetical protein
MSWFGHGSLSGVEPRRGMEETTEERRDVLKLGTTSVC